MRIGWPDLDVIRVAITDTDPNIGSSTAYRQNWEYWRTGALERLTELAPGESVNLQIASRSCTDADLDAFFGDFRGTDNWQESPPPWKQGSYGAVPGAATHYFSMPDLDPPAQGRRLGLSLVINERTLLAVGWHKSFDPGAGYAWTPPALGELRRYAMYAGPTVESLAIPDSHDWWYVVQPGPT